MAGVANFSELDALRLELQLQLDEQQATQDELFVLVSAVGILGLQGGFAMLEVGAARAKNTKAILMKNLMDFAFGVVAWYVLGWGLYYGDNPYVSGEPYRFFTTSPEDYALFVQQFGFAVTGTTIMSGAVMGRMKFEVYVIISIIFTSIVYPVAAHWTWSENGWLGDEPFEFKDFAGSGVVHMMGGIYGIIGAKLCGPRIGRFVEDVGAIIGGGDRVRTRKIPGHSASMQTLGVFMLVVGWMFFNSGSSGGTDRESMTSASRALINSLLALGAASSTAMILFYMKNKVNDLEVASNAMLAGLVSITGPCGYVDTWAACAIGATGGAIYLVTSWFVLKKLHIDDPLDAFAVHGVCGLFGVLSVGLFDIETGFFYSGSLDQMFGQLVGAAVLALWACLTALFLFGTFKMTFGITLDEDDQLIGLDIKYHEGYAYPEFSVHDVMEYNRTRDAAGRRMRTRYDSESFEYSENSNNSGSMNDVRSANGSFKLKRKNGSSKKGSSKNTQAVTKAVVAFAKDPQDSGRKESVDDYDDGYV